MAYSAKQKKEFINKVCKHIAEDKMSVRAVFRMKEMPDRNQFYKWLEKSKKYRDQYARACEERADGIFEDILNIADQNGNDTRFTADGEEVTDYDVIQRAKLRVDSRKWMLGKMNPKKYGDYQKIDMDVSEVKPIITKRSG